MTDITFQAQHLLLRINLLLRLAAGDILLIRLRNIYCSQCEFIILAGHSAQDVSLQADMHCKCMLYVYVNRYDSDVNFGQNIYCSQSISSFRLIIM